MKRSVRPLFCLVSLIVLAGVLTFRVLICRGGLALNDLEMDFAAYQPPPPVVPVFNSTLLKYAAIDVGEAQSKQEIEQLLEGNFGSRGRYRAFASRRRFNSHTGATTSKGFSVMLRSPEFYRYWSSFRRLLHVWARNKRYERDIMNELVGLVKEPVDKHNGVVGSKGRYGSCAVVGNSGILLQTEYGELIDRHEVVIRLNNARTERFERNVGAKTDISFINSHILRSCGRREGCFCNPYGADVPMVMYICQPLHFLDYTICNLSHKSDLIVTDPRFDVLCARIVKYYSIKRFVEETGKALEEWNSEHDGSMFHYSSGFQAVMLAVGICDKVSIFGFGKASSAKHHYHTNQKAELKLHDYAAEYDIYHDLVTNPQVIPFISQTFKFPPAVFYQ